MTNNYIVSISRQFGSGGRIIAERVAQRLNIEYLDRKILSESAEKMGFTEEQLKGFEEKAPSIWNTPTVGLGTFVATSIPYYLYSSTNDELYIAQTKIMEEKIKQTSCVVLGRCAGYIFRKQPDCISIFLQADIKFRADTATKIYKLETKNLEKEIKRVDKERARYYENYTGHRWNDMAQYDLVIDTSKVGIENAIDLIESYVKLRIGNKKENK